MQQPVACRVKNTFFDEEICVCTANSRPKWNRCCSHDSLLNRPVGALTGSSPNEITLAVTPVAAARGERPPSKSVVTDGPSGDRDKERMCPSGGAPGKDCTQLQAIFPLQSVVPLPANDPIKDVASVLETCSAGFSVATPRTRLVTCEKCKELVSYDDPAVLILPDFKRALAHTRMETREAKKCHDACIHSWKKHLKECRPCVDWHKKGRCRREFNCEFCHLPHEDMFMQPRLMRRERAKRERKK